MSARMGYLMMLFATMMEKMTYLIVLALSLKSVKNFHLSGACKDCDIFAISISWRMVEFIADGRMDEIGKIIDSAEAMQGVV